MKYVGIVLLFGTLIHQVAGAAGLELVVRGRQVFLNNSGVRLQLSNKHVGFIPIDLQDSSSPIESMKIDVLNRAKHLGYLWLDKDVASNFEVKERAIRFTPSTIDRIEDEVNASSYNDIALGLSFYTESGFMTEVELDQDAKDQLLRRSFCERHLVDPLVRAWRGKVTWR